ncbi:TonB-dependent receptor [Solimonas terrae]|uniref:TonB-dependent receptor n=1 Tax=Solimonas terrae TaxID=1396819 RepID=A0A6M2BPV5_9GAMM|nr:TonB-dependent receptor [Solimonas terrae]NGY04113.1 TonB-dependent receptor [Solimonas terrae]
MKGYPRGGLPPLLRMLIVLCAAASLQPAFAQDDAQPAELNTIPVSQPAPEVPKSSEAQPAPAEPIEEIIVTATKRAENPRDLPGTVTALSGADIEKHGYQGQEDFLKLVPGVTFANDSTNANRITVRGIGADLNTSNTTGVFFGDVPFDDPILPRVTLDPNPFDLARIEVLKGPQGTLFGGSALNGAVRYIPEEPKLQTWQTKAFVQEEDVHEGATGPTYGLAQNIPLGDTLAFRVVGFNRRSPGWVDDLERDLHDVNQTKQWGGRVMGLWQPGEVWKISGMVMAQDTRIRDSSLTDNTDGNLTRSDTPQASPGHTRYDLETLGVQYSFATFDALSQTTRTGKRYKAFADASRIGNLVPEPPPSVSIIGDNRSESFMQELRLTSNPDFDPDWKWLVGAFYRHYRMTEDDDILASNATLPIPDAALQLLDRLIPGFDGIITDEGKLDLAHSSADPIIVKETALFGEVTATFWDSLEATLGLRAFLTQSDSRVVFSGVLAASQTVTHGGLEYANVGSLTEHGINPKFALKYTFNKHVAAYGSASRGFRFGGPQVLIGTLTSTAPSTYKSDTVWAYEFGLRTQWLDNKLLADVTPFQIDWTDPQLQQADATGLGSYFDNVGGSRVRGVEVALRYRTPLPGLTFAFSGSYVDNVTTKPFTTSSGVKTEPGTQWPLSAKWQSATTLSYLNHLFGNWDGGGSLTYTTISHAPNTLAYLDTVFGYQTLDVMLNIGNSAMAGAPEFSLSLLNATDERGILSGVNNPQFPKDHNYIRPRTLVGRLAFTF